MDFIAYFIFLSQLTSGDIYSTSTATIGNSPSEVLGISSGSQHYFRQKKKGIFPYFRVLAVYNKLKMIAMMEWTIVQNKNIGDSNRHRV